MATAKKPIPDEALQKKAFDTLAAIFEKYEPQEPGQNGAHPPLAMEILPSSDLLSPGQLILEDEEERAIGVQKKVLVAAFLHAKHLFVSTAPSEYESKEIASATKIILLFDPEYLTAANARKQYLLSIRSMKAAYGLMHPMLLAHAVQRELWYLSSILTSPLHRQSKSPTLWFQRAWIYLTFRGECEALFRSREWVLGELEVVLKAGERHQHNYYAFLYARRVIASAAKLLSDHTDPPPLHLEILQRQLAWCKAHPSDTSGWSFLAFWVRSFLTETERRETVYLVLNFAKTLEWQGEALWAFLKSFVARDEHPHDGFPIEIARDDHDLSMKILFIMRKLCPRLLGRTAAKQAHLVAEDYDYKARDR